MNNIIEKLINDAPFFSLKEHMEKRYNTHLPDNPGGKTTVHMKCDDDDKVVRRLVKKNQLSVVESIVGHIKSIKPSCIDTNGGIQIRVTFGSDTGYSCTTRSISAINDISIKKAVFELIKTEARICGASLSMVDVDDFQLDIDHELFEKGVADLVTKSVMLTVNKFTSYASRVEVTKSVIDSLTETHGVLIVSATFN